MKYAVQKILSKHRGRMSLEITSSIAGFFCFACDIVVCSIFQTEHVSNKGENIDECPKQNGFSFSAGFQARCS